MTDSDRAAVVLGTVKRKKRALALPRSVRPCMQAQAHELETATMLQWSGGVRTRMGWLRSSCSGLTQRKLVLPMVTTSAPVASSAATANATKPGWHLCTCTDASTAPPGQLPARARVRDSPERWTARKGVAASDLLSVGAPQRWSHWRAAARCCTRRCQPCAGRGSRSTAARV